MLNKNYNLVKVQISFANVFSTLKYVFGRRRRTPESNVRGIKHVTFVTRNKWANIWYKNYEKTDDGPKTARTVPCPLSCKMCIYTPDIVLARVRLILDPCLQNKAFATVYICSKINLPLQCYCDVSSSEKNVSII